MRTSRSPLSVWPYPLPPTKLASSICFFAGIATFTSAAGFASAAAFALSASDPRTSLIGAAPAPALDCL
jgi:hypothetical protein